MEYASKPDTGDKFLRPKVYWVGYTEMNDEGVLKYLRESGNEQFWESVVAARERGLSNAEILCSMFAKMCYRSLTLGHNSNVTKTRDIWDNVVNCFDTGHSSVFEHVGFNFVIADCSRVFTHELVRHRVGVAFSQTSGRYCRLDNLQMVWDPVLDPVKDLWADHLRATEELVYLSECKLGLRVPPQQYPNCRPEAYLDIGNGCKWVTNDAIPFDQKKKITSAIRRIAPNGLANEIAYSVNLRSLRHTMLMRTNRVAEWEIRLVFEQIYNIMKDKYPLMFHGAKTRAVDGIAEVYGMKCQPYELSAQMALDMMSDEELRLYLKTRPTMAA